MRPLLEESLRAIHVSARARWQTTWRMRAAARLALHRWREDRRRSSRAVRHALHQYRAAVVASLGDLGITPAEQTGVWDIGPGGRHPANAEALQDDVLRVIQQRPEGINPVDIGNHLGIDWRSTIGPAQALVNEGKVEQIGSELYPAGEVSRR
jgi:hypothetical protein